MKRKLTPKQKKFADEYIKTGNATKAALQAGYSKKTAYSIGNENLKKPEIKTYIDLKLKSIESAKIADATEVLQYLTSVVRGDAKETIVVGTPTGAEKVERPPDSKTRISAAKELLKRYPGSDKLTDAQVRKIEAEADIAEAKATEIKNAHDNEDSTMIVDDLGDDSDD